MRILRSIGVLSSRNNYLQRFRQELFNGKATTIRFPPSSRQVRMSTCGTNSLFFGQQNKIQNIRCFQLLTNPLHKKAKASKNLPVEEKDDGAELEEEIEIKGEQVLRLRLATDRLDAVLKSGFNLSRNKIEKAFFADRIRVNGERPKKKSQEVVEGDEIDLVRRYNSQNPDFLDVSRMEILEMGRYMRLNEDQDDDEAKIPVKVRRSKNLTIQNYRHPVKGNLNED